MDINNFNLGKYVAYAVNDPKKYPRKPFLKKEEEGFRIMSEKQMEEMARRNTLKLGGKVNK